MLLNNYSLSWAFLGQTVTRAEKAQKGVRRRKIGLRHTHTHTFFYLLGSRSYRGTDKTASSPLHWSDWQGRNEGESNFFNEANSYALERYIQRFSPYCREREKGGLREENSGNRFEHAP